MKKGIIRRSLSCVLAAVMVTASFSGCGGSGNANSADSSASSSASKKVLSVDRRAVGSFIQSWYVRDWKENRWDQELSAMKKAGFEFIILQSVVDMGFDKSDENSKLYQENYTKYPSKGNDSFYPSSLPELKGACKGNDSLESCFKSARKNGIKVMIAPVGDDRWWLFGWKVPTAPSGTTDLVNNSYFGRFVKENAEISNKIAKEIYDKYITRYNDVFYGWYYNNEIWNMQDACQGNDSGVIAKIIANSMNISLDYYTKLTPGKPFMLSPYCNRTLTSAQEYKKMWVDVFKNTHFRSGDLFCPQDSIGGNPADIKVLDQWMKAYKEAVDTKPGLKFWVNNENFTKDGKPALLDRYVKQIAISAKYCEANIVFSWNHYYYSDPTEKYGGYNATYMDFVKNKKLETEPPKKPTLSCEKSGDSYIINVKNLKDNIGVAGIKVYQDNEANLIETIDLQQDDTFYDYTVKSKGIYYFQTYDYANNHSELAEIEVK